MGGGGYQAIETIKVGDMVMAAGPDMKWGTRKVTSFDVAEPGPLQLISIHHDGQAENIILSQDSWLITPAKNPVEVSHAQPGDQLLAADGKAVTIKLVELGTYIDKIVMISTGTPAGQGGTFLNVGGLVVPEWGFRP
jgi:hypothetical protein